MKCKFFTTKYKIVRDRYSGYESVFRKWWMPFYVQCFGTNTSCSIGGAKETIEKHKNKIVYEEC